MRVPAKIAAILLIMPVLRATAQTPAPANPTIRVATRLVQVQVVVHDKRGPVTNLIKDDFTVLDEGKRQPIDVFSMQSEKAAKSQVPPLPSDTFSNLPQYESSAPASVTIVLLDNLNTLYGSAPDAYETSPFWMEDLALANAKNHLMEFIRELGPRDRVALYGLSDTLHVLCDFTSNRDQLLAILKKYDTTSRTNREAVEPGAVHTPVPGPEFNANVDMQARTLATMNNEVRAEATMAALRAIAAHVADIPGRKNLVWLTANLPFSGTALAHILLPAGIAAYPVDGRALLTRTPIETLEGLQDEDAAARGDSMPAQSSQPIGIQTMVTVAQETGGRAFVNSNDLTGAIRDAVDDAAGSYTLGFYIPTSALDGKYHALKVRVKGSGLNLRYPRGYFAMKDNAASDTEYRSMLNLAIRNPLDASAIGLQVRTEKETADSLLLWGTVALQKVRVTQDKDVHRGSVDVHFVQQDPSGMVLEEIDHRLNFQLTDAQYRDDLKSGILFRQSIVPKNAMATLRVIVQDPATALVGSLIIPKSQLQ